MFERLVGKFLSRLLSKYFESKEPKNDGSSSPKRKTSSSSINIWSGYVSLEDLQLKTDVINDYFKKHGLPLELLQCRLGRVELTVPWSKLGSSAKEKDDDAVVVLVVDGVQALVRAHYEFDDAALREAAIEQRRQELLDVELFSKEETKEGGGVSGFLHQRIAEGFLKDIMEKLHIHIRDVHIRLEDVESEPTSPFACGLTLESLHLQAEEETDDEDSPSVTPSRSSMASSVESSPPDVLRKVAQVNHLAIYWNALGYGDNISTEISILQDAILSKPAMAQALDRCIERRAYSLSSPLRSRPMQVPLHTYLLIPLDAVCHLQLSTNPKSLEQRPALSAVLNVEALSLQLRDFQCTQMAVFASAVKEHKFVKDYRKYRPIRSAKEDPRAWWMYLLHIVRIELREGNMRWSWSRFHQRARLRRRYCELYERKRRHLPRRSSSTLNLKQSEAAKPLPSPPGSQNSLSRLDTNADAEPDEGAGPSVDTTTKPLEYTRLTKEEMNELQEIEDGIRGDLTVHDVVLFRALVNARLASTNATRRKQSYALTRMVRSMITDDMASEEEYERLMSYLDKEQETGVDEKSLSLVAVSVETSLKKASITLFSPLGSTADLNQHRRIQHRFLELTTTTFQVSYFLLGDYKAFGLQIALEEFVGTEIRSNTKQYEVISRVNAETEEGGGVEQDQHWSTTPRATNAEKSEHQPLIFIDVSSKPPQSQECDIGISACIEAVKINLLPECEWLVAVRRILKAIPSSQSASNFWEEISMAQINSMGSSRAGIMAKAEAAVFRHKNVDLDIRVKCPILQLSDGDGLTLSIDLGQAHLRTDRLAGVASGKLNFAARTGSWQDDTVQGTLNEDTYLLDSNSVVTPTRSHSPSRGLERSFLSSARSLGGSIRMPYTDRRDENSDNKVGQNIQSSFYDVFHFKLSEASISINSKTEKLGVVDRLALQIVIEISVIPTDHTLCRLKAHFIVDEIAIQLTKSNILAAQRLHRRWSGALIPLVRTTRDQRLRSRSMTKRLPMGILVREPEHIREQEKMSETSSIIDENEFMDAIESVDGEGTGSWFEDPWIADTESVLGGDSRSAPVRYPKLQRRPRSVSDVSSISERSFSKQGWSNNEYLSAENLARLEEKGGEDESIESDVSGRSTDSFHSALSLGGQADVAEALKKDIGRAQEDVLSLKNKIEALARRSKEASVLTPSEIKVRRSTRRALKLELDRTIAELRALEAAHQELELEMSAAKELHYDERLSSLDPFDSTSGQKAADSEVVIIPEGGQAVPATPLDSTSRAKALLRERKQRRKLSGTGEAFVHSLTSGLNRELYRCSITLTKVSLGINDLPLLESDGSANTDDTASAELCLVQCSFGMLRRASEIKLYVSIDHVNASFESSNANRHRPRVFIAYGGVPSAPYNSSLAALYPQYVAASARDMKLLRLAWERRDGKKMNIETIRSTSVHRLKVLLGDIEISPDASFVWTMSAFVDRCRLERLGASNSLERQDPKCPKSFAFPRVLKVFADNPTLVGSPLDEAKFVDTSVHISSFRIKFADASSVVGGFIASEVGLRLVCASTGTVFSSRSQLDVKCGNLQLLETNEHVPSTALELLGRRDPYQPIAQLRARAQLVPESHRGGWVVEENVGPQMPTVSQYNSAWNIHVGVRTNSAYLTVSRRGVERISDSLRQAKVAWTQGVEEKTVTKYGKKNDVESVELLQREPVQSFEHNSTDSLPPIRWRVDLLSKKNSMLFPSENCSGKPFSESPGSNLVVPVSIHFCAEQSQGGRSMSVRATILELSVLRSKDDWPLLEPMSLFSEVMLCSKYLNISTDPVTLDVPVDFSWEDRPAFNVRNTLCDTEMNYESDQDIALSVFASPLCFNFSAETAVLFRDAASALTRKEDVPVESKPSREKETEKMCWKGSASFFFGMIKIQLLREGGRTGSISFAEPLAAFSTKGVELNASDDGRRFVTALQLWDVSVEDLSSLPGVRFLGKELSWPSSLDTNGNRESQAEERPFALLKLTATRNALSLIHVEIDLKWDRVQCMLLPSFFESALSFQRAVSRLPQKATSSTVERHSRGFGLPHGIQSVAFSFQSSGLECILSSRDVSTYVQSQLSDPIGVVTFRWASTLSGKLQLVNVEGKRAEDIISTILGESNYDVSQSQSLSLLAEKHVNAALVSNEKSPFQLAHIFDVAISLKVNNLQALRTSVRRLPSRAVVGDPKMIPYQFCVCPPPAGEQRITNPFCFDFSYHLSGTSGTTFEEAAFGMSGQESKSGGTPRGHISLSQNFQVQAGFVDALVYIRQSAGGMNDTLRVTVNPILNLLRQKVDKETDSDPKNSAMPSRLSEAWKTATSVGSLAVEGIKITCVPGGATKLTESPIVKFVFADCRIGLGLVPVPLDVQPPLGRGKLSVPPNIAGTPPKLDGFESVLSGVAPLHPTIGAWLSCELSANYHNRRLVAWEPFIEPWVMRVQLGVDLVSMRVLSPCPSFPVNSAWKLQYRGSPKNSSSILIMEGLNEKSGGKIRDFRRLLRSPFSGDKPARTRNRNELLVYHPPDLCYLIMASISQEPIRMAVTREPSESLLTPGKTPRLWLAGFGYPESELHDSLVENNRPALICNVSDSKPFNINLTGALIENVQGFLATNQQENRSAVPHIIRNETGMTIRVQEELDIERIRQGERASKITISNRKEVPLSLKRSMSQSCDPHQAFVFMELGNLEDTAGRINHHDYDFPEGYRFANFFFEVKGRVPVDTVGVHQYTLCRTKELRTPSPLPAVVGFVIVRVSLQGGTKIVSVESPLLLKNNTDSDIISELRDYDGISLLWRGIIPKDVFANGLGNSKDGYVPVPVDLVSSLSDNKAILSARALPAGVKLSEDVYPIEALRSIAVELHVPPPYSKKSVGRGLIRTYETSLPIHRETPSALPGKDAVHLSTCALRIGSFSVDTDRTKALVGIPEQRMLLFRPPLEISNHLPVFVRVQARVKYASGGLLRSPSTNVLSSLNQEKVLPASGMHIVDWEDLGIVECGKSVGWTGATGAERVEVRVQICDRGGESSRHFPSWSAAVVIPSEIDMDRQERRDAFGGSIISKMNVLDATNRSLPLSVAFDSRKTAIDTDSAPAEDIRWFGHHFPSSPRAISIYVPFWIVNSTSLDLEFVSNTQIAGQLPVHKWSTDRHLFKGRDDSPWKGSRSQTEVGVGEMGLAELLQDENLSHLSARSPFEILMIGDERSTRLSMRSRETHKEVDGEALEYLSPWCDPITLGAADNSIFELSVASPVPVSGDGGIEGDDPPASADQFALRSRIISAPTGFGGKHGTRLVHVVSSYQIVNEMGREIEVAAEYGGGIPVKVGIDGRPIPFHFDDSSPIRFRPKEFGWGWSGTFRLRKKRREVTLRLLHKLKGIILIVEVEMHVGNQTSAYTIIFREAGHPPFRIENHTMHPLHFGQSSLFSRDRETGRFRISESLENTLLPYHHADFAWDEPDEGRRSLLLEVADFDFAMENKMKMDDGVLGFFVLDRIAPGTDLKLRNPLFIGQIIADGPTRVLRLSDAALPRLPNKEANDSVLAKDVFRNPGSMNKPTYWIQLKLSHGAGLSVVDWSPQELIYIRLQNISAERSVGIAKDNTVVTIGSLSVDNQLWVTPYPVLLRVGLPWSTNMSAERRRKRKNYAVSVSLRRDLHAEGRLVIIDSVELAMEPITLSVDGFLSDLIWKMTRQTLALIEGTNSGETMTKGGMSRDVALGKLLGTTDEGAVKIPARSNQNGLRERLQIDPGDDFAATAAVAAKLRLHPPSVSMGRPTSSHPIKVRQGHPNSLPRKSVKYYVERFKISTVKTAISWSGPLPRALISLPGIMRPALTFEALPVLLRPFTSTHAYGTIEDLLQEVKCHYLSIWRLFDVLVGLSFRPTFLIRACIYTWRESCARVFDSMSDLFLGSERRILGLARRSSTSETSLQHGRSPGYDSITASLFHSCADVTATIATSLRYGGNTRTGGRSAAVRCRNPRLFEHFDGRDLLVEYVEGQNAGKALLSRVRMGQHLGEGYVFHVEGTNGQDTRPTSTADQHLLPLICMVTSERVLLLHAARDENFCSVVWEATFENLVDVALLDDGNDGDFETMKFWYFMDTRNSVGNRNERLARYTTTMIADAEWGLDILLAKCMYVPRGSGDKLRNRIVAGRKQLEG